MKRTSVILNTILFAVITLFAGSCQEEGRVYRNMVSSVKLHTLNLSQYEIDIPTPESQTFTVNVSTTYTDWEFADIPEWVTVTPKSGSGDAEVKIEVGSNSKAETRLGVMSFRSTNSDWHYSAAFTITQYRAPYTISVENNTIDLEGGAGNTNVRVNSNTDNWTVIVPSSMDWCTAQKNDNGIVISVTNNTGNASRSCIIELHTDDVSEFITVTQRPAGIRSTSERIDFPVGGGMNSFAINPDAPWTIETAYSWIRVSPSEGEAGNRTIILEVNANYSFAPRNGYIYVVISADNKIEIPVHQDGIELSLSRDTLTVPSSGETYQLAVNSNLEWQFVDSIPDWISVDPKSGSGNSSVQVKIDLNREPEGRKAEIWLTPVASNNRVPVVIEQDGRVFGSDSAYIYFSDQAGTTYFNIKSNGLLWLINTADDWITLTPDYGTESARIAVSVTENMSDSARIGNIKVVTAGQKENVQVIQAGKSINISSKAFEFSSTGGAAKVTFNTVGHWTASASDSWIALSATEGNGNGNVVISVSDNPSSTDRGGEVTIMRNGSSPVRISVSQAARYLTVSTDSIVFFESGGPSDPIIVQTDGTYDVETSSDWITVSKLSTSQFTISVSENTTFAPRTGTVTVKLTDLTSGSLFREITVTQDGTPKYDYVDLGLSVYWATCNVGAETPEEYGGQYAWGEITEKNSYYDYNWYWSNGSKNDLTKYNSYSGYGIVDYKTVLDPEDDVAHVLWGGNWRMPTREELEELVNNCIWTWTTVNNVSGYKVTSCVPGYTDRYIFLPAAGSAWGGSYHGSAGTEASYWSSNTSVEHFSAWNLHFNTDVFSVGDEKRNPGMSVRPVLPIESSAGVSIVLNRTMLSILEGQEETLTATVKSNVRALVFTSYSSSDNNVATVNSNGEITAISPGTCVITASYGSAQAECLVTVTSSSAQPVAVDLGLSVKWASFNLGTDRPEGPGYYFAWGETEKKSIYNWNTYKYCDYADYRYTTKYCDDSQWGNPDNKYTLDSEDDAATVMWGSQWRTPSTVEMLELIKNCTWTWTTENGVNGYRVTSTKTGYTDQSIFLPAAGVDGVDRQMGVGLFGHYWTNSIRGAGWVAAWKLYFNSNAVASTANNYKMFCDNRFYGFPIRPVCPSSDYNPSVDTIEVSGYENDYGYVDLGLSVKWATLNVGASKPEEYGDYFAWGETEAKSKYTFDNYKFYTNVYWGDNWEYDDDDFSFSLGKYVIDSEYGTIDSKAFLEPEDDVAHVKWGGNWRMPLFAEYYELVMNCDLEMTTWNGMDGWKATSKVPGYTDRFIFLPSAGVKATLGPNDDYSVDEDSTACYWSNTIGEGSSFGLVMNFDNSSPYDPYYSSTMRRIRMIGAPVRPVIPSQSFDVTSIALNKSSITMDSYDGESLSVTTVDGSDNVRKYPITWSSSDAGVAWFRYGAHGIDNIYLYGVSPGTATITATIGSAQASCTVTITPVVIDSIALDHSFVTDMSIGDTLTISPTLFRGNRIIPTTDVSVQWQSSDSLIVKVDKNGLVTAVGAGECTITISAGVAQCTCYVSVLPATVPQATPEYVDLGLSVNWATFNVGANAPEEYGDYFAWGETEPHYVAGYARDSSQDHWKDGYSDGYNWSTYKYCNGSETTMTKYCFDSEYGYNGFTDNETVLALEDDAAYVNWGGDWRMPTKEDFDDLLDNCDWAWITQNGVKGYKVTSRKDSNRSIFLPAAGDRIGMGLNFVGTVGFYWSSSLNTESPYNAWYLYLNQGNHDTYANKRNSGFTVRPVCPSSTYVPPVETVDSIALGYIELNLTVGDTITIDTRVFNQDYSLIDAEIQWASSDSSIAMVDKKGLVTATGPGSCIITASADNACATCSVIVVPKYVPQATPEYVDLGLSVNWATFNVGANAPEESGDYYAWGEIEPYYEPGYAQSTSPVWKSGKTSGYEWSSYTYCYGSENTMSKYCSNGEYGYNGYTDTKTILDGDDDVAHVEWGGNWRLPTNDEYEELIENCTWTYVTQNGVKGYKITSNVSGYTDNYIFLPNAGVRYEDYVTGEGFLGNYWTSSLNIQFPNTAADIYFDADNFGGLSSTNRRNGLTVRPVCPSSTYNSPSAQIVGYENGYGYVDLGLSVKFAAYNVGADSPVESGDYFAWGETETYYESGYAQSSSPVWKSGKELGYSDYTYKYKNGTSLTKYCTVSTYGYNGFTDNKTVLDADDDVAHVKWGGRWRMMTQSELEELRTNCVWIWVVQNGVHGYKIKSMVPGYYDRFIFLPVTGKRVGESTLDELGSTGFYVTSTLNAESPDYCRGFSFSQNGLNDAADLYRVQGHAIRPVFSESATPSVTVASIDLNRTEVGLTMYDSIQIVATPNNSDGDAVTADVQWVSSDPDVAFYRDGWIVPNDVGTCTITANVGSVQSTPCSVTITTPISSATGYENEYGYVDLGLSVKWATYNVGALAPEEYGDYYAWGETEYYYKGGYEWESPQAHWKDGYSAGYSWSTYKYCNSSDTTMTKYNNNSSYGPVDNKIVLDMEDDAASMNRGGNWRIPTKAEFEELIDSCTWTWITRYGVNGFKVTSNKSGYTDRSIFLPAAGARYNTDLNNVALGGFYWSSSLFTTYDSWILGFGSNRLNTGVSSRFCGYSVRPVCP